MKQFIVLCIACLVVVGLLYLGQKSLAAEPTHWWMSSYTRISGYREVYTYNNSQGREIFCTEVLGVAAMNSGSTTRTVSCVVLR